VGHAATARTAADHAARGHHRRVAVALPESFGLDVLTWLEAHAEQLADAGTGGSIVADSAGAGASRWGWLQWRDMVLGDESHPEISYYEVEVRGQLGAWPPGDRQLVENLQWAQGWVHNISLQMEAAGRVEHHPPATAAQRRDARMYCNMAAEVASELAYYAGLCGTWRRRRARAAAP
jgi:hypothetical protein